MSGAEQNLQRYLMKFHSRKCKISEALRHDLFPHPHNCTCDVKTIIRVVKDNYIPNPTHPVDGELRRQIGELVHGPAHAIHGWDTPLVNKLLDIFAAHLQTKEKALPKSVIEIPNLPYFQIEYANGTGGFIRSQTYDTKDLPAILVVEQIKKGTSDE